MEEKDYSVIVVLDRQFAGQLLELAKANPVWIIDSPENRAQAEHFWNCSPVGSRSAGVTLFHSFGLSAEEELREQLDMIVLHHPVGRAGTASCTALVVVDTGMTPELAADLGGYGFVRFEPTPDGFIAFQG